MKKFFGTLFIALVINANLAFGAISEWKKEQNSGTKTRLIASFYQTDTGEENLIAGLEFNLPEGWKIYGQGSENIGLPPSFDFSNSKNYLTHQITWPQAQTHEDKIGDQTFKYLAYHNRVILPINIDLADNNQATNLSLKLNYGLCKDICIPVNQEFFIEVVDKIDNQSLALIQEFYPKKISEEVNKNSEITKPNMTSSIFYWIFIAILGGAILNVMPCVLPVLSIKLLSIINHLNVKISRVRFAFFATICGIVLCFFIFAILATLIKYAGNSFGWGLQFQNPYFLIFLIVVLVLFAANLLGIFEITFDQFILNALNKKIDYTEKKKNIFIPNFLSGILAVLLATPCSAPLLGSAISFALTQKTSDIFLIFCAIGLGFSLPYFILLITPKMIYLLPKPGNWMLKVKKLMALFLLVTIFWLAYVLSNNIGFIASLAVTILALILLLCFEIKLYFIKFISIVAIVSATFAIPTYVSKITNSQEDASEEISSGDWIEFDEKKIHQLVMLNKVVVIDVTADWCLTCKINKLTVLNNKEVIKKLSSENIITMRADITKPDMEVMKFLQKHNRFAIPFNAIYGPNAKSGLLTSELLTKKELFELIDKAQ